MDMQERDEIGEVGVVDIAAGRGYDDVARPDRVERLALFLRQQPPEERQPGLNQAASR